MTYVLLDPVESLNAEADDLGSVAEAMPEK